VIDAIVYRKPVALKAVYYLIEKRLKQGLNFPDSDFNALINENEPSNDSGANIKVIYKNQQSDINNVKNIEINNNQNQTVLFNNSQFQNVGNNQSNANNINFQNISNMNSNGITKHNSQLLPKRHGVQIASRSNSQKNVDFKSIFNNQTTINDNTYNRNLHSSTTNREESTNINNSNSPSPDFIAAAMSPIKTNNGTLISTQATSQLNSASSNRNSRQTNYQEAALQKKSSNNIITNNSISNSNNNINFLKNSNEVQSRNSAISNGETRMDHYYVQLQSNSTNNNTPDDNYQQVIYYQTNGNENRLANNNNNNNNASISSVYNRNQIRSLPGSIYRGSPERSLPRSPDRVERPIDYNNFHSNRPTTSRVTPTRQAANENLTSEKTYDSNNQRFKVVNYLSTKRSLTSCDESGFERNKTASINPIKTRQLPMGKAKIDLDTQTSINILNYKIINK
jgi:hypothetical protein